MSVIDDFKQRMAERIALIEPDKALPGRDQVMATATHHYVLRQPLRGPFDDHLEKVIFGLGCFWGAEKQFWPLPGVKVTAVGYCGGYTPNPNYEEVCSGKTGHNEVVLVVYDPKAIDFPSLLKVFWESHVPTQGMRQGNDVGSQYRSGIYYFSEQQKQQAEDSKRRYHKKLEETGHGNITTEILPAGEFYYAEDYHQQYLAKNPGGYCGLGGTGIAFDESQ